MQAGNDDPTGAPRPCGRRALAAAAAALAFGRPARAGSSQPPGEALGFRIHRDGSEVGSHRISFERRGNATIARVAIDIVVRIGWITVYRFSHHATELWQGERFSGIQSRTDDNGSAAWMHASWDPNGTLRVAGSGTAPYAAPPGALASTYWNSAILRAAPVISSQDGKLTAQRVLNGGLEDVPCVGGTLRARRHEMRGERDMEIWYDLDDRWAYLRFRRDGAVITYLRG